MRLLGRSRSSRALIADCTWTVIDAPSFYSSIFGEDAQRSKRPGWRNSLES